MGYQWWGIKNLKNEKNSSIMFIWVIWEASQGRQSKFCNISISNILSQNESALIHRFDLTQKHESSVGDLVRLFKADKQELGIELTDEEIQGVSQEVFDNFVQISNTWTICDQALKIRFSYLCWKWKYDLWQYGSTEVIVNTLNAR